ncbi:MAG TPA: hypothetical protein VMM93_13585 [Vicinamibacterales bacterium]|nr:hypothetical protein [Vicinamibacterales bacterium]
MARREREREGLPSSYRMRAESHYVDHLTGHRPDRPAASVPADPPARPVRAAEGAADVRPPAPDERHERLLSELTEGLNTITAAATLLSTDQSPMARRVNVDLIRAEAWRAAWMLRADSLLSGAHRGRLQPRDLGALFAQMRDGFAPECRLNGLTLHLRVPAWGTVVPVDETALVAGVSGAVVWTLSLVGRVDGAVITVVAGVTGGHLETIEVSQDVAATTTTGRPSPGGTGHPGGDEFAAALGASVAKAAAELHHGDAAFLVGDGRRSTVRFTFKRSAA